MNTPNFVRQKAVYEKICEFKTTGCLFFPREDKEGSFHVVSSIGEIFKFNDSISEQVMSLNSQATNGLCFDSNGFIYVTDLTTNAIFFKQISQVEGSPVIEQILTKEYDNKPFKGPTALAYNPEENILYFADSGIFENASWYPFESSVYSIDLDTRVLKCLISNLSFISDICYDSMNQCIYIAETFMNRIIRLKQNDDCIFHTSMFYQFSGRVGPSCVTLDENGNLYVARYEYSNNESDWDIEADGLISVVNKDGWLIGELNWQKLPEISGWYISPKKKEDWYVTVKNSTGLFKIKISTFSAEMDKYEEAIKLN